MWLWENCPVAETRSTTVDAQQWDARYQDAPDPWGSDPNAVAAAKISGLTPARAVDLACGNGRNARWMASSGWRVTAVDFSAVAIAQAERADRARAVEWQVGDATQWQPQAKVDLVLIAYLHLPSDQLATVLERAATWLAPGGRLLYLGHAAENLKLGTGGPQDPSLLRHVLRPSGSGNAVDVLCEARSWD
jgi:SAM-dependent methyltransferase